MIQENLADMVKNLNTDPGVIANMINDHTKKEEKETPVEATSSENEIKITNFYDWFEIYSESIKDITRVKTEVSNVNSKDNIIFKKKKDGETEEKELISFYNPNTRPILNLPPIYMKVFKNDTFEVLHQFNDQIFIKSYGVKTGLILVYCANVDGKVVPFERIKIKKNVVTLPMKNYDNIVSEIKAKFSSPVDSEAVQLLYKQAIKVKDTFTTKEVTLDWFLKKQSEVVDINHLLKIDGVLITVI